MTAQPDRPRRRVRRGIILVLLFVSILAIAVAASSWWLSRREPDWYRASAPTAAELNAASESAERKIEQTISWAQDQQVHAASQKGVDHPRTQAAASYPISISEAELNGFFHKWDATFGWSQTYAAYVTNPVVALRDGQIILAARVQEVGAVVSVEIWPRLENGQLHISVARVLAGSLPLPRTLWARYTTMLANAVRMNLNDWRDRATISSGSGANSAAVAAAMSELLINALDDRPSAPNLFLPYSVTGSTRSLPVRITDLSIQDQTLRMDVDPLTTDEQRTLLTQIRSGGELAPAN